MNRLTKGLIAAATVAAGLSTPLTTTTAAAVDLPDGYLQAVQRDLGLSAEEARTRLAQESSAVRLHADLIAKLGKSFAGSWFDPTTGALTVAVTDERAAQVAHRAGAKTSTVSRDLGQLESVKAEFDRLGGAAGIAATRVDPRTNSVVITTVAGRSAGAVAATTARHGAAVRTEEVAAVPATTAEEYLDGGELAAMPNGRCSIGFNGRLANGLNAVITAGHCSDAGNPVSGWNGTVIGDYVLVRWRDGNDYAATNLSGRNWLPWAWVSLHTPNDAVVLVRGSNQAPVGASVCKSGVTTGWTCGVITAMNETVFVDNGATRIDGLTRHSACSERGDSGGSNMSADQAQGVSSASVLNPVSGRCGQAHGQPNVSWFQPINEVLANEGMTLETAS